MSRNTTVLAGALLLALALFAASMFSGRGTPESSETAPAAVPVPGREPPPLTISPETPPGRTLSDEPPPAQR